MNHPERGKLITIPGYPEPIPERRSRARVHGMSLQINILTTFVLLLSITIISIISFAYYKNSSSILDLTERFINRVAVSCIDSSIALFDPVASAVKSTAELVVNDEDQARDGGLFPYLISTLQNNPQMQSIYLAFDNDGRFLQAFPIPPNSPKFGANDMPPPAGAEYALRVIDRKNGGYSDVWSYVKRDGTVLGQETSNQLNYDPRPRPWYKDAIRTRGLILSDLLVYTSNRQPGVTAAAPIFAKDGRVIGAAAANISTNQISDFLAHLDLGPSGLALMIDESEQIIAYPDASRTLHQDGLKLSLVKALELGEPRITDAFAAHHDAQGDLVRFTSMGHSYLASFTKFPPEFGKKWQLVAIVLENDFVGTMKANTREIVAVGVTLLIICMICVGFLAHWITKPLRILSGEIQKIQKFDLVGPIALHSVISEVNELIHSLNMMKRALRTFGMFVPRDLVRELVASGRPIELGGQDRTLTVMFTDIADFTSISERMQPSDLLVHVSRHLSAMTDCITDEHGTVDKYIGDAVMAFWGAPMWVDDHAHRGCIAALKAQHVQLQLNKEWEAQGLPAMFVRIGLHTSNVIVGNIGSTKRMSYTVVGDGVNVASRLEGVNKVYGTNICVSEAVLTAAGPDILARPLDKVAVKGRQTGELVFEIVALHNGPAELLPSPWQMELCQLTRDAFAAYQSQQWQKAAQLYQQLATFAPQDKLPGIFIERCQHYLANPPKDWTGVYTMKTK